MHARFPFSSRRIKHALLLSAAAAACAAPLLAVHAAPPADALKKVHAMHRSEGAEPYALVRGGSGLNMTGDNVDSADIEGIKRSVQGEFFWFRKDGKEYIVQDAATLARVRQAWAPMEKTGAEMEKHGKEMGRHGEAMGAYGTKMALAAASFNQAKMEALGKQMEDAGKPMEALGKKMEVLGEQMEAQQKDADRATRAIIGEALANGVARPAPKRS
jgi:outer membrane murein-binding lipoprotein Lpp